MPGIYPGTQIPFDQLPTLAAIREPVLDGPGHAVVADAAFRYRLLGNALLGAAETVRGAGVALAEACQGAAADVVQSHLRQLAAVGDLAEAQAQLSCQALTDQTDHVAKVRSELAALADPDIFAADPTVPVALAPERGVADQVAGEYQTNTNYNLGHTFAAFDPPASPQIGPAGAGIGGPGVGSGAVGPAGTGPAGTGPAGTGPVGEAPVVPGSGSTGVPSGPIPPVSGGSPGVPSPHPDTQRPGGPGRAPLPPAAVPVPRAGPGGGSRPVAPGGGAAGTAPPPGALPPTMTRPGQPWRGSGTPRPPGPVFGGRASGSPGRGGPSGYGAPGRGLAPDPRAGLPRGTTNTAPAANAAQPSRQLGGGHVPLVPATGSGRQRDTHERPPWLLEDDPESIWFAGIPAYTDPVIDVGDPGREGR